MSSTSFADARKKIDNVLFVYLNMYIALDKWVDHCAADLDMEITFEEGSPVPKIEAKAVVASHDFLVGAVLIHMVMQVGRIMDQYFRVILKPSIIGKIEDDTWYSPEAIELIAGFKLNELFGHSAFIHLNLIRNSINAASEMELTQPQMLELVKSLTQFLEEFDARFTFEQNNKLTKRKKVIDEGVSFIDGCVDGGSFGRGNVKPGSLPKFLSPSSGGAIEPNPNPGYPDEGPGEPAGEDRGPFGD